MVKSCPAFVESNFYPNNGKVSKYIYGLITQNVSWPDFIAEYASLFSQFAECVYANQGTIVGGVELSLENPHLLEKH